MKVARAQSAAESRGVPGKCEQCPRNRGLQNGEVPDERTHERTDGRRTDERAEQRPSESLRVRSQTLKADTHSVAAPPQLGATAIPLPRTQREASANANANANANADCTGHVRARGVTPRRFHANVNFSHGAARTQNSSTSLLSRSQYTSEKLCKSPVTNERTIERTKMKHLSQSELTQAHANAQRHKAPEPE